MFLINIHCPLSSYDITFEPTKTSVQFKDWNSILSIITEALCTKWSGLARNLHEEHLAKQNVIHKRKLSWQHVDPSYQPRCSKDMPIVDSLCLVGGTQNANQAANTEQDLTFCIAKGIRTPRKKKAHQEHNLCNLSTYSWSFQSCSTRKRLDGDVTYNGNQRDPEGMENRWYEKESLQGCEREEITSGILQDDRFDQDNSLLTRANLTEIHPSSPVVDIDAFASHLRHGVMPLDRRRESLSVGLTESKHLSFEGTGESMNCMIDCMQTPSQLHSSFVASSSGVRRRLYEINMKSSCKDDFWCHSERQTVSNFEIQYRNLDDEGLWNNNRATLCIDFPEHGLSEGCGREFEEKAQHDHKTSIEGSDSLLEYKSSLYPHQQGTVESDSMPTYAVSEFSFLGKEGKASLQDILMEAPDNDLIERPQSKDVAICSFLTPSMHSEEDEILCKNRVENYQNFGSKQNVSKNTLKESSYRHLQRSLSAPPFYQPPVKFGANNGLSLLKCPRERQNRLRLQAGVHHSAKGQGFSTADTGKVALKERQLASPSSPLKDGHQTSAAVVDFTLKERVPQEERLLCQGSGISLANDKGGDCLQSKWRDTAYDITGAKDLTAIQLYKSWKNPCIRSSEPSILHLSSVILGPSNKHLLPESITKQGLQRIQVLQQMDKKFIASVADGTLLVIDQHAADERIRLEQLRKEVLGDGQHLCTLLDHPKKLSLNMGDQELLLTYKAQVEEWGWRFKTIVKGKNGKRYEQGQHENSNVLVTAVPSILGESLHSVEHLLEYLHQLTTTDGTSAPPPAVQRVLASKACRGAIMFGDHLLRSECQQLVEGLKKTALSFQCAHGRPTLVPIVNLEALHSRLHKLHPMTNSENKLDSSNWHGLVWHRPTLVRAMERLQSAAEM
ncbi:hypothetical protein L7F22_043383 [Adiantum nelumboides]|nr:hypothetical protein [Adiantum nelumboides]